MKPYIGISGITTAQEARALLAMAGSVPQSHTLALGAGINVRATERKRYVDADSLKSVLAQGPCLHILHYTARNPREALIELKEALGTARSAIQFNDYLHELPLSALREEFKDAEFILPVKDLSDLNTIRSAQIRVDRIIFDPSGGNKVELQIADAVKVYQASLRAFPMAVIGFAGGFTPQNVAEKVRAIRKEIGNGFSIDVESGVREGPLWRDKLCLEKAAAYLRAAGRALR